MVAQVAISLALLSVSQLYIGHLRHLRDRSLGFDRDRVLLMSVNTSRAQNREQLAALYRDVVARLHAIPGVDSVAASGMTPMSGGAARSSRSKDSTSLRTTGSVCPSIPCRRTISSLRHATPGRTRLSRLRHGSAAPYHRQSGARAEDFLAVIRSGVTSGSRTSAIPTRSSASLATRRYRRLPRPLPSSTSSP